MLLIQIKTGLVPAQKIDFELQAFNFDDRLRRSSPSQNTRTQFEPFGLSDRSVITFDDSDVAEQIGHCSGDQILSDVHRQGQRLQNELIAIAVDD